MDEYIYDSIDLLKRMIAIPSISREEDAVASVVTDFATKHCPGSVLRHGNNIICTCPDFDPERPTILLNSHIDTVRPAAGWQRDPHTATIEDDRIYGLGSNDAGASVVSLLAVYRALCNTPQSYNLIFVASCEEEVSGKGGIESVLPLLPPIALGIVGEPTGMNPAVAEKGLVVLDGEIEGKAGHAARNEGVNAIYQAIPVIEALRNFRPERESEFLGPIKVSVTQIQSGTAHNVVPDICRIVVDVRTTDAYTNEETVTMLRDAVGVGCRLTPRSVRLRPSSISPSHPLISRAVMLGGSPFGSPTLSDQALMPFPTVKIGPGDSARSHTADEYITFPEIRHAVATYHSLLAGLEL